jgi:hypothetical protein
MERQGRLGRGTSRSQELGPLFGGVERELIIFWHEGHLPLYTWYDMTVVAEHKSSQVFALVSDGDSGFTMDTTPVS